MWSLCFIPRRQNKGSNLSEGTVMVSSRMEGRRFVGKFQHVLMSHPWPCPPAPVGCLLNWFPFPFSSCSFILKTRWPLLRAGKAKEVKKSCKAKEAQRHEASPLEYTCTLTKTYTHMHAHTLTQTRTHACTNRHRYTHTFTHTNTQAHTWHTQQSL